MARKPKASSASSSEVTSWIDRIKNAERERERIADEYHWDKIKAAMKGDFKRTIGSLKGTPVVPVNLIHAFVRTAIPSLYFRDPKFAVNAMSPKHVEQAKVREAILNYKWRLLKMKQEVKKCLADAIGWAGHGWIKVGYTADVETEAEEASENAGETDTTIKDESIWAYRVSPRDIVFNSDESIDPPYDCRWIAHRIVKPLETAKKMFPGNDSLTATFYGGLKRDETQNSKLKQVSPDPVNPSAIPMVEIWEVTDMDSKSIRYVVEGYDKYLADPKPFDYKFKGFNFSMLKFNPVPDEPYPYSDIYVSEPQIWEITKLLSMALNHIKRFSRQLLIEEGTMAEAEMDKFKQGIDGAIIQVRKGGIAQGAGPTPIPYPPIQTDLYNIIDRLMVIFDNIVGQSAFDRGSTTATKTRTLGEVDTIQRGTQNRASEKQDILEDFVEEVGDKLICLTEQFVDVPEFVNVTGLDPQALNAILNPQTPDMIGKMATDNGFYYSGKDIAGKYMTQTIAGSMRPLDHDSRNNLLIQILRFGQGIGLQPGDPASNEIGREMFDNLDMYGVAQAYEQKIAAANIQQQIQQLTQQRDAMLGQVQQAQGMVQQQQGRPQMGPPQGAMG